MFIMSHGITILHFVRDPNDDNLQIEWDHLVKWSMGIVSFNLSKCKVMDFNIRHALHTKPVRTSKNTFLENVQLLTVLGVTFSADLKWNLRLDAVLKKASKRLYIRANSQPSTSFKESFVKYCA